MTLRSDAHGKWPSILSAFGVDKKYLINKHGPCPLCNEGTDRFRFDDKGDGRWICSQCGAGSGVDMVMRLLRVEYKEACREIGKIVGAAKPSPIRVGPNISVVKKDMNAIWSTAHDLDAVRPVALWWERRVGFVPKSVELKSHTSLRCGNDGDFCAMVAKVRDVAGNPVNLHRTYMTEDGQKAPVSSPRRVMPAPIPEGSAVRLTPATDVLGIAEGLETAVAATKLFGVPCWAALNAFNLQKWLPPEGVRVVIFGDNDASFTGQMSAHTLAHALTKKKFSVEVKIPDKAGWDWADMLEAQLRQQDEGPGAARA